MSQNVIAKAAIRVAMKQPGGIAQLQVDARRLANTVNEHLKKSRWMDQAERTTTIPRARLAAAGAVFFVLFLLFGFGAGPICNTAGFVYPLYRSYKALQTPSPEDDVQWLTYWVVFGFVRAVESVTDVLFNWVPLYHFFKLLFLLWCYLPHFQGATRIYHSCIAPLFAEVTEDVKELAQRASFSIKQAAGLSESFKSGAMPRTPPPSVAEPLPHHLLGHELKASTPVSGDSPHAHIPSTPPPSLAQPQAVALGGDEHPVPTLHERDSLQVPHSSHAPPPPPPLPEAAAVNGPPVLPAQVDNADVEALPGEASSNEAKTD